MRISEYFDSMAAQQPDAVALIENDTKVSFGEANRFVHAIANALDKDPDIGEGAHVALYAPNHLRVPLILLGINHSDRVWLSAHTRNPVDVNIEVLSFMDCEVIFFHSAFEQLVPQLREGLTGVRKFICIDGESEHGPSLDEWISGHSDDYTCEREDKDARALLQPTGGTTGPSKAVVHTHSSLEAMIVGGREGNNFEPGSRYLAVAPLTHAGGILALSCLCSGGSVVVMNATGPVDVMDEIARTKVTHTFLPPTLLYAISAVAAAQPRDMSSLLQLTTGSAPVAPDKVKEANRLFGDIVGEGYALTECGLPLLVKRPHHYLNEDGSYNDEILASAGRPIFQARVEIMDENGNIVPNGERGEIVVRANTCMKEYYKNPEATAEVIRSNWWHSGDVGIRSEDGFITIVDRIKDMIVSGGFNIYPAQVEKVVLEMEAVLDCAVVGTPDEKWGESVTAVIQLRPGATLDEESVIALCKERLGGVYAPKQVKFWEDLPRSAVGKVLRRKVRETFWSEEWRAI